MNERSPMQTYMNCTALHKRGWTDRTIRKFLGEADATKPNPYYRSAAPMRLYLHQRVEEAENCKEWNEERKRTECRQAVATRATATKKANLLAKLNAVEITVPQLPMATLTNRACAHYNKRKFEYAMYSENSHHWDYDLATPQSNPAFLARIMVNYLRHDLTSYENELRKIVGKVGVKEGYKEISRRVYAAIAATYPLLAEECDRQLAVKTMV